MIRLYHTSTIEVRTPDVFHSREHLDFGRGFYLTTLREQAEKYGQRFLRKGEEAILNIYDFDEGLQEFTHVIFDAYDNKWLDYITACRRGQPHTTYDIIEGGIADDQVFDTIDLYFSGEYTATSRHWTNYDSSIPTIKSASPTNLYLTNIFISWNL